jgi:CRP/FNR family transcriptional regulator
LFSDLDVDTAQRIDDLAKTRFRVSKGGTVYRPGTPFRRLYAIHSGSLKTVLLAEGGHEQVAGYYMPGDVIGLDGIGKDVYECEAIALEESEVCAMPFDGIEQVARDCAAFQRKFHRYLAGEIGRQAALMLLLGSTRADQRLAVFLLDLSQRYKARGYSPCEFILRMTRHDIATHLGLKIETISRLLTRFQAEGLIQVEGRVVKLIDLGALREIITQPA